MEVRPRAGGLKLPDFEVKVAVGGSMSVYESRPAVFNWESTYIWVSFSVAFPPCEIEWSQFKKPSLKHERSLSILFTLSIRSYLYPTLIL